MLRLGRAFMRAAAFVSFESRGGWCEVPETGEISKCSVALALGKIAQPYARASRPGSTKIILRRSRRSDPRKTMSRARVRRNAAIFVPRGTHTAHVDAAITLRARLAGRNVQI